MMKLHYAIVFVSDMARSVAFYRDYVGLPVRFETPQWTEFATGEATLALHGAVGATPSPPHHAGSCRPGLTVADLDAFHARMTQSQVACVQAPTATFGVRIAQYLDPDGVVISVSQRQ